METRPRNSQRALAESVVARPKKRNSDERKKAVDHDALKTDPKTLRLIEAIKGLKGLR